MKQENSGKKFEKKAANDQKPRSRKRKPQNKRKGKEVELNVEDSQFNKADFNTQGIRGAARSTKNDASWYAANEALLRDSASFNFARPLGSPIHTSVSGTYVTDEAFFVPTILISRFIPCIGMASSVNSGVNLAALQQYSYIRYANSGSRNYGVADVMKYEIALASAFMMYSHFVRTYGIMRKFELENRLMPTALVEALGFSYTSLRDNLAQFRAAINTFAYQLGSFCVPGDISLIARHCWMCSGYYKDSDSAKAQLYAHCPDGYYFYEINKNPAAGYAPGQLTYKRLPDPTDPSSSLIAISTVKRIISEIMTPLLNNEDYGLINGDIQKAYGIENCYAIAPIGEDYTVEPDFNLEVLSQIQNSVAVGDILEKGSFEWSNGATKYTTNISANIYERTGSILDPNVPGGYISQTLWAKHGNSTAEAAAAAFRSDAYQFLNMYKDDVSPADSMVASRLKACFANDYTSGNIAMKLFWNSNVLDADGTTKIVASELGAHGTEVVTKFIVVHPSADASGFVTLNFKPVVSYIMSEDLIKDILCSFDYHPLLVSQQSTEIPGKIGYFIDFNNFAVISAENIETMNLTATLSEFDSPQSANFAKQPYRK